MKSLCVLLLLAGMGMGQAGVSGSSEPKWPTCEEKKPCPDVQDGDITWHYIGRAGMGQEKPCPSFESFAQDMARRHILKESLVDDAFPVDCLPSLLSDATAKRVNEIEAERLDLKPEPQFVPAVKKTRKVLTAIAKECLKPEGCRENEGTDRPIYTTKESWSCADSNRVLLQSENKKIAVCMKVAE